MSITLAQSAHPPVNPAALEALWTSFKAGELTHEEFIAAESALFPQCSRCHQPIKVYVSDPPVCPCQARKRPVIVVSYNPARCRYEMRGQLGGAFYGHSFGLDAVAERARRFTRHGYVIVWRYS